MGIWGFYSWVVNKYPKVVVNAIQETTSDATSPNPNGFEFDNLYLDLNGVITDCFNPDQFDDLHPTTFQEVFTCVFEYVDRLFNIVRPRKLLYLAIDGVPPKAKLSGVREVRSHRASHRTKSKKEEDKKLLPEANTEVDDPIIISPGTVFMYELSKALQGYIQSRLKEIPAWKDLKVIFSDANVPGEGEQKIVQFMRSQRSLSGYDMNTRHCIHGLDADLIMLALATHELHISILRETLPVQGRDVDSSKPSGSCKPFPVRKNSSYQFVQIWILKEYLELEMKPSDAPEGFKFDVERVVDDFILICFLLGNDFLPNLPSLDVREGAVDLLMTVYKREFKSLGGYIVDSERIQEPNGAYLSLERLEKFVLFLGSYEDQILQKRTKLSNSKMRHIMKQSLASISNGARDVETPMDVPSAENDDIIKNRRQLKEELRKRLEDLEETAEDEIKYGSEGWKDRYYNEFFVDEDHIGSDGIKQELKGDIFFIWAERYTEGLCWVFLYYLSGVPSWTWLYPYYYGPCASDFKGIDQLQVEFQQGVPFEPFTFLTFVSLRLLPRSYKKLKILSRMRREYALLMNDGIEDFLPLYTLDMAKEELTEYEVQRNSVHTDVLFVRALSDFGSELIGKNLKDPSAINGFIDLVVHPLDSSNEEGGILCLHFHLPKPSFQTLHILDNVGHYPPKTVYESDIKEITLWHEHNSPFQDYRFMNQKRSSTAKENEASGSSGLSLREGLYNHPNLFRPQRPMATPPQAQGGRGRGQCGYNRGSGSYQRR